EFSMDFTLSDPYFYGGNVSVTMSAGSYAYVWNDGYDVAASGYMQVDFYRPLYRPWLLNPSTQPDSWVRNHPGIAAGEQVRLVINRFACDQVAPSTKNMIANITSYGARFWFNMLPGTNKLQFVNDKSTSGYAVISFRPPYV